MFSEWSGFEVIIKPFARTFREIPRMRSVARARGRLRSAVAVATLLPVIVFGGSVSVAKGESVARDAVYGIWASSGTMIEVTPAGESLSARIIALKNPSWREKDGVGVVGEPKTDLHNPDEAQHGRSLIGLEMLSGYEFRKDVWRGELYLATNGSTWRSTARIKNGELRIRGYVGVSWLGKTQSFAPLDSCNENILRMIRTSGMTGTPCDDRVAVAGQ